MSEGAITSHPASAWTMACWQSSATVSSFDGARPDLLFRIVEPDTTPPRLIRAEARDSFTVQIEFDDPLVRPQPGSPAVEISDSTRQYAIFEVRVGEAAGMTFPGAPGTAADTTGTATDTTGVPIAPPDSSGAPPTELPSRFVTVRLAEAISSGMYRVRADSFLNLRRLLGGGDTTFVAEIAAPVPDSAIADSVQGDAGTDTSGVDTDTSGVDTVTAALGTRRGSGGIDALTRRILLGDIR